jgi:hypothetical protein
MPFTKERKNKRSSLYYVKFLADTTCYKPYTVVFKGGDEYLTSAKAIKQAMVEGIIRIQGYKVPFNAVKILKVTKITQFNVEKIDPASI